MIDNWQIFFENNILASYKSQFYQTHFFVKKINRWGNNQDRLLIITNRFMFNTVWLYKNFSYKIEKIMWADSLKSIMKIQVQEKKNLELKLHYDTKLNKKETTEEKIKEKSKSSRGFLFTSVKDKHLFISNLRRLYFGLTGEYLKVEAVK